MAIIGEGSVYQAPKQYTRRLSTETPSLPTWVDPFSGFDDTTFNDLFGSYTPYTSAITEQPAQLVGMSLPDLGLSKAKDWTTDYAPQPKVEDMSAQLDAWLKQLTGGTNTTSGGTKTKYTSGGKSAYGWTGNTGVKGTRGSAPYGLQPEMWAALVKANSGMKAAGLGTFSITDGWRSYAAQVDVKRRKPNYAATPGNSIHGLGYAADLKLTKAQQQWLYKNGSKYGLYAGAGFSKEPWHWQYMPALAKPPWSK